VLLVEDDAEQRQALTSGLVAAGFRVTTLPGGDGVLAAVRLEPPDVVLLDVNLPSIDGHAVCRLLKSDAELSSIPVLFISASVGPDDRVAGLMLGADDTWPSRLMSASCRSD
jgi:DNA-binding response OmpR family regulator